jgi:hypothetical protein
MDDVRNVLKWNNTLVDFIKEYTGDYSPTGLHGAVNIIQDKISVFYLKKLRWIAAVRNNIVHENMEIPEGYFEACNEAYSYLCECFKNSKDQENYDYTEGVHSENNGNTYPNKFSSGKSWTVPIIICLAILIFIYYPYENKITDTFGFSSTISVERDDDFFNKDDYFINIKLKNIGSISYNGMVYVSFRKDSILTEKEFEVDLKSGRSDTVKLPIDYSLINRENADSDFVKYYLEGSLVTIETDDSASLNYDYVIKDGELNLLDDVK